MNEETKDCARLPVVGVVSISHFKNNPAMENVEFQLTADIPQGQHDVCRLTDAQARLAEKDARIAELERQATMDGGLARLALNAAKDQLASAEAALDKAQARIADKDARIAQLAAHARGKNKALANALKEIERFDSDFKRLGEQYVQALHQITTLRAQLEKLQAPAGHGAVLPWIPVGERLPESERTVLAYYLNSHSKVRRIRAEYIAAKTKGADDGWDSDCDADYDEATDQSYWPAGWYEVMDNWDDLTHVAVVESEVTHWMPLPAAPATADSDVREVSE